MAVGLITLLTPFLLWLIALRLWNTFMERTADQSSTLPLPPGRFGLPFVGETFQLLFKGYDFFRENRQKYGRIYKTHLLGKPTIRVFGSDNIKAILKSEDVCVEMQWPKSVKILIGERSLMCSTGELHYIRRKNVMSAFTENAVFSYLPSIQNTIRRHLDKWRAKGTVLGEQESRYLATDLAFSCILGYKLSQREIFDISKSMSDIEKGFYTLPYNIPGSTLNKGLSSKHHVMTMIDRAINDQQQLLNTSARRNVLRVLLLQSLEGSDEIKIQEIRDTCMEMIFSSIEGISSAICTMLLELAKNVNCTDMAAKELFHCNLLESQQEGDLTASKLTELPYVKRIIKEILRLTPPMGGGYRKVMRTIELEGYQIPKGWTIIYSIRDQHETGSEDCKLFDPDRWLPYRDITKIDEYLYIPFGGKGHRSCVGERFALMCLEVMAVEAIRSCQWRLMNANPAMKYFPVPYPNDGLPLTFSEAPPFRQRRVTY